MIVALLLATASGETRALSFEAQEARLARELAEGVSAQRVVAAGELSTLSRAAAWPLVQVALADPEIEVRARGADAAGRLGLTDALPLTRAWLEDEDPDLRAIAIRLEGLLGDASSVPLLSRALGDARFSVRAAAAEALGALGLEACAAPLGSAMEDTDATVRVVVAEALGHTPGAEAIRLLLSRSLDSVLEVRVQVIESLAHRIDADGEAASGDARITAVLVGALADEASEVRIAAILGLALARHSAAAPLLARIVDGAPEGVASPGGRAAEASREARAAVAALGRIDEAAARACLVRTIGRGALRGAALDALRVQHERSPIPTEEALTEGLLGPSAGRTRLAEALLELGSLHGGDAMTSALLAARQDGSVPPAAVLPALGSVAVAGGTRTEDALVALLDGLEDGANASPALDGLERLADRGVLDARAVDPLLLSSQMLLEPRAITLLGRLDDVRAAPRLVDTALGPADPARQAALEALAITTHLDGESRERLLSLVGAGLGFQDPRERLALVEIARRHGDGSTLAALLDALEGPGEIDRALAIELVTSLVDADAARADGAIEPGARERASRVIVEALSSTDARLSSAASSALLSARPALAEPLLIRALEARADSPRRGDAVALSRAGAALGVTLAPADEGERDLELARSAGPNVARLLEPELRYPASVDRSFALLTAVRRGLVGVEASPQLCALAARREPSVRANAGLALAWLGAACEDVDPISWVMSAHSVAVQLAGLHWVAALARAGDAAVRPPMRRLARALGSCVERASDPGLRESCAALGRGNLPAPDVVREGPLDVIVVTPSGAPDRGRLVALRFSDGATVILRTDGAGRVALQLDRAVGGTVVEDPYATVLER